MDGYKQLANKQNRVANFQKIQSLYLLKTGNIKPSQYCPQCGKVHPHWADLSNKFHVCADCNFEEGRDRASLMVMYNVATNQQPKVGTPLVDCGCLSSTDSTNKRKPTGSYQQLRQRKRQKPNPEGDGDSETPSFNTAA